MKKFPQTLMLLGSGELGKEVAIASKRLGCEVIACDRYPNAPAMQIADKEEVINMLDPEELKKTIYKHMPDIIIPEIEAVAVESLIELEKEGFQVIPNAKAAGITMNRDKIRNLANQKLGLKTARFDYASSLKELQVCADSIGWPVIVKPIMSSSGKGQSFVSNKEGLENAWEIAMAGARGNSNEVIVEEFINFNLEITLLTIRQKNGSILFCPAIGHKQSGGDYQCSWQPAQLTNDQLEKAQDMAKSVVNKLGGIGLFGVEFFISNEEVIFSELSPRPHDTGLVTLISQNLSEFELHVRAILGIPIPSINICQAAASRVILAKENISNVAYQGIEKGLSESDTELLIFGKPTAQKGRRMGVALAKGRTIEEAQTKADKAAAFIELLEK